jgi:GntR family transcriptional regulator, rspAB operon transcriptional repressor
VASGRASDRAYRQLHAEILDGTLAPGLWLGEVEQSARLGVSRTPLREALARLAADGLVAASRGRGVVVAEISGNDVDALFEMRACLEAEAARLAAEHVVLGQAEAAVFDTYVSRFAGARDALAGPGSAAVVTEYYALIRQFDEAIDASAANAYLVEAMAVIRTHFARVRRRAGHSLERLVASADEHGLIAEAIRDGNPELANHAVRVHLHLSRRHFQSGVDEDAEAS